MKKNDCPTVFQSSIIFLLVVLAVLSMGFVQGVLNPGLIMWINQLIIFVLPIAFISIRYKVDWRAICRIRPVSKKQIFLSVLIGIGAFFVFFMLSAIVEVVLNLWLGEFVEIHTFLEGLHKDGLTFFLFISGVMVLAPICEELLFRGLIQNGLGGFSHRRGWILAGLLFGILHFGNQISNAVGAIFLGLILSYVAFVTGTIWTTIIIHGVVNGLGGLFVHIPAYYNITLPLEVIFSWLNVGIAIVLLVYAIKQLPRATRIEAPLRRLDFKSAGALVVALLLLLSISAYEVSERRRAPHTLLDLTQFDHAMEFQFKDFDSDNQVIYSFTVTEKIVYDMAYALNTQLPVGLQLVNLSGTGFLYREGDVLKIYEGSDNLVNARFTGFTLQPGDYQLELITSDRKGNLRLGITKREPSPKELPYVELLEAVQQGTFTQETYQEEGYVLVYHEPLVDGEQVIYELAPSTDMRLISAFVIGQYEELSLVYKDEERAISLLTNFSTTIGFGLPPSKHPGKFVLSTEGATGDIFLYILDN